VDGVKASRADRAAATRQRIVDAAYDLFCELGYRATTMAAIGERAGVAVQTVYFTFRTKDALLQEVHHQTVLGRDDVPPREQPWFRTAVAESDPRAALGLVVHGVASILARVAPLLPVWPAAAGDPAAELFRSGEDLRRQAMRELAVDVLLPKAPPARRLTDHQAGDLLFVLLGPQTYRAFVLELGWSPADWASWTIDALCRDLFP
jgi:AcrR family transcriptional regulator